MQSWIVHYKNKYPGCLVQASNSSFDVYRGDEHLLCVQKDGAGQWADQSEALGLPERHDLAPIPKDARVHKVQAGKVGLDEDHESRKKLREKYVEGGKVLSMDELKKKKGLKFDDAGREIELK